MKTLRDCFYSSQKFSDKWDRYFDVYERHLSKFKGKNITLVEIGIQNGGSLEMWSKYLGPESKIYGIDVDPSCSSLKYENNNVSIIIGDQASENFWNSLLSQIGQIDVLIDDGGHKMNQQIVTFEKAFPKINSIDGVFICEDCHTSYWDDFDGGYKSPKSFIEYSKDYIDILNYEFLNRHYFKQTENNISVPSSEILTLKRNISRGMSGVFFYDSMVVFEKNPLVEMKRVFNKGI